VHLLEVEASAVEERPPAALARPARKLQAPLVEAGGELRQKAAHLAA
jgi:hypothetical protein